ncbi:hypothetical protein OS189_17770 [Sulfitobacter sp. F26169L]|uniref:hypothetical protein n=1 Tax=Sulfitobacter sp. F26169L TaxID=2996015 RepID=UPI002260E2AB|nr:hypothetical protein [Sulfitobacter sp. F26169L]MCX7568193.1 hypothetical protein [Sulfitobacter sp. F26169L]
MTNTNKTKSGTDRPIGDKAKEAAAAATTEAKATARSIAENVTSEAGNYAGQAKDAAADEVKGVASALRTAAEEMRSGSPQERTFSQIAEGLADASDAMRDKDLSEMVGAVTGFAKRNPMVFLGSAALIGFAATRFAKASGEEPSTTRSYGQRGQYVDLRDRRDAADTIRETTPSTTNYYKETDQ